MRSKKHLLVGRIVKAYIDGGHKLGKVVAVDIVSRTVIGVVVRDLNAMRSIHCMLDDAWDRAQEVYCGKKYLIAPMAVSAIWPGRGEAWVTLPDFLDWAAAQ